MRQGLLCVLLIMLSLGHLAHAEDAPAPDTSVPLSLSAGARITDLQQRLADSERLRGELTQALKNADTTRESSQLAQLRKENQRLKQQLETTGSSPGFNLLTDSQQWFVIGGAVALLALLCGIFAGGGRKQRRQWL